MGEGKERGRRLVERMYAAREAAENSHRRSYLGASAAGASCPRSLWYNFHWCDKHNEFDGRMLRLFETGELEEARFEKDLRFVDAYVVTRDPENHKRQISCKGHGGHFGGHMDAVARGVPEALSEWVVVEMKTHNEKSFKLLEKDGVQRSKPQHYTQLQLYMESQDIKEGLYLAKNKNNDALYAEFVERDDAELERAHQVIDLAIYATCPPGKISNNPAFYLCKMCDSHAVCQMGERPPRSCRTCQSAHPVAGEDTGAAIWHCEFHGRKLNYKAQQKGCEFHRYNPQMMPADRVAERIDDYIMEYDYADGYSDKGPSAD